MPFLVCKTEYQQKDVYTFGVCLDGSHKSDDTLKYVMQLAGPEDKIIALFAPTMSTIECNPATEKSVLEHIR